MIGRTAEALADLGHITPRLTTDRLAAVPDAITVFLTRRNANVILAAWA